jgi:hypothetical protein
MGSFERPFLLFQDHLFAATADGISDFTIAGSTRNMVIPIAEK